MAKKNYTADGIAKVFHFDFPFFQPDDVVVVVNGHTDTPGFALQIAEPNPLATFPYTGGEVHFADAPAIGTNIEIRRKFVMQRPCDYHPTEKVKPDDLNRDFNFNLENMKDFREQYGTIIDMPDVGPAGPKGDKGDQGEPGPAGPQGIPGESGGLPQGADVVIEVRTGLTSANWTNGWYRKYASGWVEQGFITNAQTLQTQVSYALPIPMVGADYFASITTYTGGKHATVSNRTPSALIVDAVGIAGTAPAQCNVEVKGMMA